MRTIPQLISPQDSLASIRTLIVDDHPAIRNMIDAYLSRIPGIEIVGHAVNGRQAVEMTRTLSPHLVIMDVQMPIMNGIEATRAIKALPAAPCVMIVSSAAGDYVGEARSAGADACFEKRDVLDALRLYIDDLLAGKGQGSGHGNQRA